MKLLCSAPLVSSLALSAVLCVAPEGCGRGDAAPKALESTGLQLGSVGAARRGDSDRESRSGSAVGAREAARAVLPGDKLAFRFVDHAGEARLSTTPGGLAAAWAAFKYPYKLPSPYSGLRGESALRAVEVALADTDVAGYGNGEAKSQAPVKMPRFDPVWNRTRAVYQSRSSLLAPTPSRYVFKTALPRKGLLTLAAAVIPQNPAMTGAPIEFSVEIDGEVRWRKLVTAGETGGAGRWLAAEVAIEQADAREAEVAFVTRTTGPGAPIGMAVYGNPLLWSQDEGTPGPNVLFVVIDTLRADAMGAMPNLNQYARRGSRFNQAITAATWTRPSILSMLGGDLPTAIGQSAEAIIPPDAERRRFYALGPTLLPRLLRARGWRTTAIGNNFFLLGYPQIGLDLGFEEVADVRHPVLDTPAITRAAIDFLRQNQKRPFFLHLHYDAPHWPYTPPPEHLKGITDAQVAQLMGIPASERAGARLDPQARAYLGEAAYADAQIGLVLAELQRLGLRDRTLVIIVGDHGEVFDPRHNHYVQSLKQPTLYHHGWSAYDEILRVPLLLGMPGRLPGGTVVNSQVRLTDVAPTVLELLGLGSYRAVLPSGGHGDGQSLLPLIFKPGAAGAANQGRADDDKLSRPAYAEGQNIRALRHAGYLYLRRGDGRLQRAQGNDGIGPVMRVAEELYDLQADPFQHNDLLASFYAPSKKPTDAQPTSPASPPSPPSPNDPLADPRIGPILGRLREEFSRHTPQSPEQGLPLVHLMLAPDARAQHLLTGTLVSSDLGLSVQGVKNGEVVPRGPGRIEIKLRAGGVVDVLVDPTARLELSLARDGLAVAPRELLLGPFSLPLLSGRTEAKPATAASSTSNPEATASSAAIVLDGALLDRLSSSYAPVPGERGEILLWRDQTAPGLAAASTSPSAGAGPTSGGGSASPSKSAAEVETLMRDWGYARPATTAPAASPAPTAKSSAPVDGGP